MYTSTVPETVPPTVIVLGRDWENREGDHPMLSMEARMTVLAAGVLTQERRIGRMIFSGGLLAENGTSEADAMRDLFIKRYPQLADNMELLTDSDCFDTRTSAQSVKEKLNSQPGEQNILLGTRAHMKRAKNIFEDAGLDVQLVVAEPLFASLSSRYASFEKRYRHSPRNITYQAKEAVGRAIMTVDKDGKIITLMANRTRKNKD